MQLFAKHRLMIALGLGVLLAACTTQAQIEPPTASPEVPAATEVLVSPQEIVEEIEADPEAAPTEAVAMPTPRPGLSATSPGQVNLAAGNPTLVEFFAFW